MLFSRGSPDSAGAQMIQSGTYVQLKQHIRLYEKSQGIVEDFRKNSFILFVNLGCKILDLVKLNEERAMLFRILSGIRV
jgi:hypothetical protein